MAKVLVLGSGGREHALAACLERSPGVERVFTAPGNAGTAHNVPIEVGGSDSFGRLASFVRGEGIGLTVVGPELPLCGGIADYFAAEGLPLFGPVAACARLEGNKAFARRFMERQGIPHPAYAVFDELGPALEHVGGLPDGPVVVKAAGLAAGKGVIVCADRHEARRAVEQMLGERVFGQAGTSVVIEEYMEGEEASVLAICDGRRALYLVSSQDHKRVGDGDQGPNTGGMGAYAPAPVVSDAVLEAVDRRIVAPTLEGLREAGSPYRGCLYVGLMICQGEPRVVEFNCRFGDPETQAVLPLLASNFYELLVEAAAGDLGGAGLRHHPGAACCVVMASGGYPGQYAKGKEISGLEDAAGLAGLHVFHAGTRRDEAGRVRSSGGRVLGVTGVGPDIRSAIRRAYEGVACIHFEGCHYRRDIGHRALERAPQW
jgi:phosphoribosylamine--glycine ligase